MQHTAAIGAWDVKLTVGRLGVHCTAFGSVHVLVSGMPAYNTCTWDEHQHVLTKSNCT